MCWPRRGEKAAAGSGVKTGVPWWGSLCGCTMGQRGPFGMDMCVAESAPGRGETAMRAFYSVSGGGCVTCWHVYWSELASGRPQ